jgi:phage FluMu gp28-like protein
MDYTVITPFDLNTFNVGKQDRFNQVDWNLQKARIEVAWHKFGKGNVVADATGVGDPIVEDLSRSGMRVEPFKFTEQSKRDLLQHLAVLLEQDKIKIPNDPDLLAELDAIQWELTDSGKTRISTVEGMHDDRVMSLALAVWGCNTRMPLVGAQPQSGITPDSPYDGTLPVHTPQKSMIDMQMELINKK